MFYFALLCPVPVGFRYNLHLAVSVIESRLPAGLFVLLDHAPELSAKKGVRTAGFMGT